MSEFWHDWRGSFDGRPAMYIRRVCKLFGCRIDLHKFVRPDDQDCFHTHPATAVRIILWGGYVEELEDGRQLHRRPGYVGIVRPALSHRVAFLLNGPSYSIWLRGAIIRNVWLNGDGWPADQRGEQAWRN